VRQVEDLSPIHTARSTALLCTSSTAQYCAALHCTVLRSTAQYHAVQRSTAQRRALLRGVADMLLMLMYAN